MLRSASLTGASLAGEATGWDFMIFDFHDMLIELTGDAMDRDSRARNSRGSWRFVG